MKKSILLLLSLTLMLAGRGQKCLDLNIAGSMGKMETPGDAESSFKKCKTEKEAHGRMEIQNYGTDLQQLDSFIVQTTRYFNTHYAASIGMGTAQMPSQQQLDATKDLAAELKSMTPEQQKEWAMKMAQQRSSGSAPAMTDDPSLTKLVYQTNQLAVVDMKKLNDEFNAKIIELNNAAETEIKKIPTGDKSKCPTDQTGLMYCDCPNKIDAEYWKKVIAVRNKYDAQKVDVYRAYLPKIKNMAAEVDNVVARCKFGDALHSPQLTRMLYSEQAAAFGNAFLITYPCIEQIRKDGSDVQLNKLNSDLGVYEISCTSK